MEEREKIRKKSLLLIGDLKEGRKEGREKGRKLKEGRKEGGKKDR